jgi:hypothetical protein
MFAVSSHTSGGSSVWPAASSVPRPRQIHHAQPQTMVPASAIPSGAGPSASGQRRQQSMRTLHTVSARDSYEQPACMQTTRRPDGITLGNEPLTCMMARYRCFCTAGGDGPERSSASECGPGARSHLRGGRAPGQSLHLWLQSCSPHPAAALPKPLCLLCCARLVGS